MAKKGKYTQFAVLGMGRFGMSIVQTLSEHDVNIMACDKSEMRLQQAMEYATLVVQADIADENALKKLGLGNFEVVILAVGEDFEASQIAAMVAKESGVKHVVVKARNRRQKMILESMGVDEVILPEHEMGAKLARKLTGSNIMDILEESSFYTITEMRPMDEWRNKTIQQADIRRKHNLTILAIRRGDKLKIPVLPDAIIAEDDILIVLSENHK
jgi:trk system potassium uptake protein TrkA